MRFNLIVAMCRNNGIGYKGQLPWKIPQDLHYFSQMTTGDGHNAVIMGHNTWKSLPIIPGKLPGLRQRDNFILTSSGIFHEDNNRLKVFKSIEEIEGYLEGNENYEEVWVIGGAQVYKQFLEQNKIQKCYVTFIDEDFYCDAFFPELDPTVWKETERRDIYDITYDCKLNYIIYDII